MSLNVLSLLRDRSAFSSDLLHSALTQFIGTGTLHVTYANGRHETYGDNTDPVSHIVFHDAKAETGLLTNPSLKLGEAYMDGRLELKEGDLYDLLHTMVGNRAGGRLPGPIKKLSKAAKMVRRSRLNDAGRSRKNVAHHYDLDGRVYDLFLDQQRQYSCAYFEREDMTLDEAQTAKISRIARKLAPKPGLRALDIGSGWGGMGVHLAKAHGLDVTGVTLSDEQLAGARARAEAAGVSDKVSFELIDYRNVEGQFDRIVSVGMAEHVGKLALDAYFAKISDLLAPDGVALIHFISRYNTARKTNPWLEKYIFPGGYIPPVSEAMLSVERSGMMIADIEIWRTHYAHTLGHWRRRFLDNWDKAEALYDARFCRMFDYYLASSQASFSVGKNMIAQFVLIKDRHALPQTRSYMEG